RNSGSRSLLRRRLRRRSRHEPGDDRLRPVRRIAGHRGKNSVRRCPVRATGGHRAARHHRPDRYPETGAGVLALRLYCATTNPGKLREFQKALSESFEVESLPGLESIPPCEETGQTLEENAIQKALYYSRHCDGSLVVDDPAVEVDALGGAPGVYPARFAGPDATD